MGIKKVTVLECTCERCGHVWVAENKPPQACSKCRSTLWDKPRVRNIPLERIASRIDVGSFRKGDRVRVADTAYGTNEPHRGKLGRVAIIVGPMALGTERPGSAHMDWEHQGIIVQVDLDDGGQIGITDTDLERIDPA